MDLGLFFFNVNSDSEYWYKIFSKEGFRISNSNVVILNFYNDSASANKNTLYTTFKNGQYLERSISHCIDVESIYLGFEDSIKYALMSML